VHGRPDLKYSAISGSWRSLSDVVADDVNTAVQSCIVEGRGIVTGGALGVDFLATERMLYHSKVARSLVVVIPTPLDAYVKHYRMRADEGVITASDAHRLEIQLRVVRRSSIGELVEMTGHAVDTHSYFARNSYVLSMADELLAFHLDDSPGTADTIAKALAANIRTAIKTYKTIAPGVIRRVE